MKTAIEVLDMKHDDERTYGFLNSYHEEVGDAILETRIHTSPREIAQETGQDILEPWNGVAESYARRVLEGLEELGFVEKQSQHIYDTGNYDTDAYTEVELALEM
ncbi:MAG: hypothetical protein SVV03_02625 [Candidatus Nanohaloarchaea archaeon]|nr:hypothetical protein [Candidatus Nanohaloarchaea archaeon]